MYSPLPVYTVPKKSKGWNPRKGSASFKSSDVSPPQTASSINAPSSKLFQGFNDMLDPALDGPPSPGRLRAVANQVRKNSVAEKHDSQQTYSSGSSSILSAADRPSWEHGIESLTVSRRSSQRSRVSHPHRLPGMQPKSNVRSSRKRCWCGSGRHGAIS